ncbi:hypothetical protein C0J52_20040 [Blattella germanica]|nr:hypothetical protein C0J52_20040 [Blattella germanica]
MPWCRISPLCFYNKQQLRGATHLRFAECEVIISHQYVTACQSDKTVLWFLKCKNLVAAASNLLHIQWLNAILLQMLGWNLNHLLNEQLMEEVPGEDQKA